METGKFPGTTVSDDRHRCVALLLDHMNQTQPFPYSSSSSSSSGGQTDIGMGKAVGPTYHLLFFILPLVCVATWLGGAELHARSVVDYPHPNLPHPPTLPGSGTDLTAPACETRPNLQDAHPITPTPTLIVPVFKNLGRHCSYQLPIVLGWW